MKKRFCFLSLIISSVIITGCDGQKDISHSFIGHWQAVSKADGRAMHPKSSSSLVITCSESVCHVLTKNKSVLSDDELVSNTDWNIKDEKTLMRGNGLASIYLNNNQLITNNFAYERQKE